MDTRAESPVSEDCIVRKVYTKKECREIVEWLIVHEAHYMLRGTTVWKQMSKCRQFKHRSWQSLKDRFRRHIFPQLHVYGLSKEDYEALRTAYFQTEDIEYATNVKCDGGSTDEESEEVSKDDSEEESGEETLIENVPDAKSKELKTDSEDEDNADMGKGRKKKKR